MQIEQRSKWDVRGEVDRAWIGVGVGLEWFEA